MQTMKEKELMVDDWVESSIEGIGRITEIARDGCIALTYGNNKNAVVGKIGHLQPIPLTAEIFENNGFDVMVFDNGDKVFAYVSLCIIEHKGLFTFKISDCRKRINYVHELQHALRLCGIDKEIEL